MITLCGLPIAREDFDLHRATYYADLNQPLSADEFVASLKTQLTTALASFERFMAKKPSAVAIGTKRGKRWITLLVNTMNGYSIEQKSSIAYFCKDLRSTSSDHAAGDRRDRRGAPGCVR
ncbi:MAG TPA: hypothetical protein VHZ51_02285, partial [Ktedonobacteraceae bacterium]|nr:hypothetical protein [Ktedonobacteraceae bacterium]